MLEQTLELQNLLQRITCLDTSVQQSALIRHGDLYYLSTRDEFSELGPYQIAKRKLWDMLTRIEHSSATCCEAVFKSFS